MAGPPSRLFFAYGSSLSISEMLSHGPTSTFYGIAVLRNHRWFVNERGSANIAPSHPSPTRSEDVVWGIIYTLRPFDEELLDKHEGLPWAYNKEDMDVEAVSISEDGRSIRTEVVRALVYIDRDRVQAGHPLPEFVTKMIRGVQDAIERGVPKSYIDKAIRGQLDSAEPTNGSQARSENKSSLPRRNVAPAPSNPRKEPDLAIRTQGITNAGHSLNSASHKANPNQNGRSHGLQDSIYAPENSNGVPPSQAGYDRDASATRNSSDARSQAAAPASKQLECWYWRTHGSCRKQDHECNFAHHDTGTVAAPPGKKAKGVPSARSKKALRPEQTASSRHFPDRGYYEEPVTPSQSHAFNDVSSAPVQSWKARQEPPAATQSWQVGQETSNAPPQSWDAPAGEAAQSKDPWAGQAENLMDSQPEWLVSNTRTDVKW